MNLGNSNDQKASDTGEKEVHTGKSPDFTAEQPQGNHKVTEIEYVFDDIIKNDFTTAS